MTTQVIKKDGSRQPFDAEKIKRAIKGAAKEAGLSDDRASQIIAEISGIVLRKIGAQEEVTTSEIKAMILSELDRIEPSVSQAWRTYEQSKGK